GYWQTTNCRVPERTGQRRLSRRRRAGVSAAGQHRRRAGLAAARVAVLKRFELNPERIAELEGGGWRAYYDRDWRKLLTLMVQLNQEQFHIPFPLSVVAALHVARGSVAWAP